MHDFQMWDDRVVHVLPEQRSVVETVKRDAVGEFDDVELAFLGHDLFNVGFKRGIGFEDFGADAAGDGGLDFGFGAGGEVFFEHAGG
jgi:hypothetical protein